MQKGTHGQPGTPGKVGDLASTHPPGHLSNIQETWVSSVSTPYVKYHPSEDKPLQSSQHRRPSSECCSKFLRDCHSLLSVTGPRAPITTCQAVHFIYLLAYFCPSHQNTRSVGTMRMEFSSVLFIAVSLEQSPAHSRCSLSSYQMINLSLT